MGRTTLLQPQRVEQNSQPVWPLARLSLIGLGYGVVWSNFSLKVIGRVDSKAINK
jgi:hypothetical protein